MEEPPPSSAASVAALIERSDALLLQMEAATHELLAAIEALRQRRTEHLREAAG